MGEGKAVTGGQSAARVIRSMDRPDADTVRVSTVTVNAFAENVRRQSACGYTLPMTTANAFAKNGRQAYTMVYFR